MKVDFVCNLRFHSWNESGNHMCFALSFFHSFWSVSEINSGAVKLLIDIFLCRFCSRFELEIISEFGVLLSFDHFNLAINHTVLPCARCDCCFSLALESLSCVRMCF